MCLPAMLPAVATAVDEVMLLTKVDDCNTFNPSTHNNDNNNSDKDTHKVKWMRVRIRVRVIVQ